MTGAQRRLLEDLAAGAYHIAGAQVQTARRLESAGLVTLEDHGSMVICGRVDGERWACELTDAGRAALSLVIP